MFAVQLFLFMCYVSATLKKLISGSGFDNLHRFRVLKLLMKKEKTMPRTVDPQLFGLHHTTIIEQSGENRFALVMNRKSRIIMADGKKILQKAARIIEKVPGARIFLRTTAPVCSKTRILLQENNVELLD